ncbi:MAG: phosphatidylglycerophosphatase A [Gammaproteobacteria bacterium]|uniref:phosphatidylglycerophosphatase A family protein n=1 Tax=Pseudomaricurvus alcaniphilus TaxID=1166482 RepID=UPI001409386D|nr:phosphatidylglycerophosphatase A [Pseudomaricurvus alcaniphilus]MBR9912708.1 phosphatidylglycerophosphatase A [Gammaproteobacteria bacterium]NHN38914.1 phosphatidylglycerophosphatase A [Pseudomaricurvus alcaniphilus]
MTNPSFAALVRRPVHFLAFGFGSGLSPKAPGTMGTLAAIPLYLLLAQLSLPVYAALVLLSFVVGVYLCHKTAQDLDVHDHPGIVWDEFVGFWITMLAAPPGWLWLLLGFLLFRLFDVLKPWPISWCDRKVEGGFGIMIDDVLAGLMALLCLQLAVRVLPL